MGGGTMAETDSRGRATSKKIRKFKEGSILEGCPCQADWSRKKKSIKRRKPYPRKSNVSTGNRRRLAFTEKGSSAGKGLLPVAPGN